MSADPRLAAREVAGKFRMQAVLEEDDQHARTLYAIAHAFEEFSEWLDE